MGDAEFSTKHLKDNQENNLIIMRKGKFISLFLKLKSETSKRKIGKINVDTKVLHIERNRKRHLFRKLNAYGICFQIIEDGKLFDKVRIKDDFSEWLVPKSWILENKIILNFQGKGGFELQVFLPLDKIEEFKRPTRY
tara:strand:+ start:3657 stop:4070 length:414 start_codon:yes stop_codon:yes gene_type:complete